MFHLDTGIADNYNNPDALSGGEKIEGLKIFKISYEGSTNDKLWVGISLAESEYNEPFASEIKVITNTQIDTFAKKYNIKPKMYLLNYIGY